MMNVEFPNLNSIITSHNIEIFGYCNFNDILPLLPCRAVARIPLNAKSVIMCAFPYLVREYDNNKNISYYACVPDYHVVVMDVLKKLSAKLKNIFPDYSFQPFTDSSPIREVKASKLAGLGCIGKNGLLITKKYGSFVFLGEIVTDMPLQNTSYDNRCIGCGLCEKNCPTKSIYNNTICEDTCLSAITQKKGELSEYEKSLMISNHTAWGCDKCQTICPMNKEAKETYLDSFISGSNHYLTEDNITKLGAYYWRGKKTILRNIQILNGNEKNGLI